MARAVAAVASRLQSKRTDVALWIDIKRAYEIIVARRPDSDFYRTFFNSVTRDLFGTVGVNPEVEFCATNVGRASGSGADPGLPRRRLPADGGARNPRPICHSAPRSAIRTPPCIASARKSAAISRPAGRAAQPESIELIEPVFYRGMHAFAVGRLIGDGSITPLVLAFTNSSTGVQVDAVMLSRADVGSLFGYARSYFHVDLPVVSAAITLLRSFMPRKSIDELYTVLGRAKQGKTERYFALQRHLDKSIDSFVHAPGRARPGHDRLHPALPRSGVQGDPRPLRCAEDQHARGRHRALSIRVPARPRRPPGRCAGIQTPAAAARALHARSGR